ncbi:MAG TPA: trypsin-like peptidase domain-containing protein [Candidatus Tyrphobacter sp.]|nr:trypsin-like peptidase domain-containing protein [Candidatus Tyrphobacter sp.]
MNKKLYLTVFSVGLIGVFLGSFLNAQVVRASFLQNLFDKLNSSFSGGQTAPTSTNSLNLAPASQSYSPPSDYEQEVIQAVKKNVPSVVSVIISQDVPIVEQCPYNPLTGLPPDLQQLFGQGFNFTTPCTKGTQLQETGAGTGFIVSSDGIILTNKHVASDPTAQYTVITNDGHKYSAKILARDPIQDLAVLKINAVGLPAVTLGDSDNLNLGQTAIAIGNALGQFSNTVSVGVVSGLSRTITASGASYGSETIRNVIQTDAAINPGNSGGPLLNLRGEVIGVDTAVVNGAQNIGFAIPINQAKRDIAEVEQTGQIQTPFLGVRYVAINASLAAQNNLPVTHGVLVQGDSTGPAVIPNSPAAKAGLKSGDIILAVDGVEIDENNSLSDLIAKHNVGEIITLTLLRGGKQSTLKVTLEQIPSSF